MTDYDQSLIEEFVTEAKEHLETVENELLVLEEQQENVDRAVIDRIFRAVHSIKGAAGFLGLKVINDLSHAAETLLSDIRAGERTPTPELVDLLLRAGDRLTALLDDLDGSNDANVSDLLEQLHQAKDGAPSTPVSPESPSAPPSSPSAVASAKDDIDAVLQRLRIDRQTLENRPVQERFLYLLACEPGEGEADAFFQELAKSGTVLGKSTSADVPARQEVLFSSVLEPEMAEIAIGLPRERIKKLETEPGAGPAEQAPAVAAPAAPVPAKPASPARDASNPAGKKPAASENTTIRLSVELVDRLMMLAGELVLVRNQHQQLSEQAEDPQQRSIAQRLNVVTSDLQEAIMLTRMQPVGNLFGKFPRIVRDLGRKLEKKIEIEIVGSEVELDKTILENLSDPLTHLIRNCCDHGLEPPSDRAALDKPTTGRIDLRAYHEGGQINIMIRDDGRGIDPERVKAKALENNLRTRDEIEAMSEKEVVSMILLPGFSTATQVTDVSGRGVGMDVVKSSIEKLGGSMEIDSTVGQGTTILLRLPLTLAIISCLIVKVGEERFAIPQVNLEEVVALYDEEEQGEIELAHDQEVYRLRDKLLPLVRLDEVLNRDKPLGDVDRAEIVRRYHGTERTPETTTKREIVFAVVKVGGERMGLIVDDILGTEEIVVKPLHRVLRRLVCFSGGTIMGDGRVALILDMEGLARHAGVSFDKAGDGDLAGKYHGGDEETQTVLLFRYGPKELFAVALPMVRRIETITVDQIEQIGEQEFITIDGVSTFVLRLDRVLTVSACSEQKEMFLLLPRHIKRPIGLLMSEIIDSEETSIHLNRESYLQDGLLGTAILREHMTLFPDMYRLLEKADPEWGAQHKRTDPNVRKRVLLVEDTAFFRQLVKGYLERGGFEVETAENGREGLQALEAHAFDLIVSDLQMPLMDGFAFAQAVRQRADSQDLPLVALTALSSDEDRARAFQCGFQGYETKLDRERFLDALNEIMETRELLIKGKA